MITSAPIQVILHFVGLAVFSPAAPSSDGLEVILPRVVYQDPRNPVEKIAALPTGLKRKPDPAPQRKSTGTSATQVTTSSTRRVEDHIALLVFRANSYVSSTNWNRSPLPKALSTDTAYEYVKLDGDRVQITSGVSGPPLDTTAMQLPPLEKLCPKMQSLDARFQPPYPGAAAVFDLPQGKVNACYAGLRIDTEVNLDSNGDLVVSSGTLRAGKELRLHAVGNTVELIVANVPVSCLNSNGCKGHDPSAIDGLSHTHAYYGMVDPHASASCSGTVKGWNSNALFDKPRGSCTLIIPRAAGGHGMSDDPAGNAHITDFECSNTKWP